MKTILRLVAITLAMGALQSCAQLVVSDDALERCLQNELKAESRFEACQKAAEEGHAVDGGPKAPKSGEHKIWGLTFWITVFSQSGSLTAGSLLPAMKASCVRGLRRVTRRAGAQRRSRGAA